MKCPKCDYVSFDYNQVCPKCEKDISDEQAKLNLPQYRPNPPYLLAMLTGEIYESDVDDRGAPAIGTELAEREMDIVFNDDSKTDVTEFILEEAENITAVINRKKLRLSSAR